MIIFLKTLRRLRWEKEMDWDIKDKDRLLDSTDVLEEDLQDFMVPAVMIGSDVVRLYTNLAVNEVVNRTEEED